MKVLVDPIYTNDPHLCSASYKMQTLMRHVLDRRDDVFFYCCLPDPEDGRWNLDWDWLLQHDNVRYLQFQMDTDRMREYARISPQLEELLAFNGPVWDWDVLITGRSTQVPTMRMWMSRATRSWCRRVIIEDEFPIMSFKKRVNQPSPESADLQALNGYQAADRSYIFSMASKGLILQTARTWLSPSRVRGLDSKLVTAISRTFDKVQRKSDDIVAEVGSPGRPFSVAYTQRLSGKVDRKDDVLDTFFRQFAMHGGEGKMRLMLTTNSRVADRYEIEKFSHLEVKRSPREEFWRLMREEVDLIIAMSPDEDYPLSLIEPVTLGVPLIVGDAPYVRPTFGDDYPFIVNGPVAAYAMVKEFHEDYVGMYSMFSDWLENWFVPEMERRNGLWFGDLFLRDLEEHETFMKKRMAGSENEIMGLIHDCVVSNDWSEFTMDSVLKKLDTDKKIKNLYKLFKRSRIAQAYSMSPNFNEYRQLLLFKKGYKDLSTEVGHLGI